MSLTKLELCFNFFDQFLTEKNKFVDFNGFKALFIHYYYISKVAEMYSREENVFALWGQHV